MELAETAWEPAPHLCFQLQVSLGAVSPAELSAAKLHQPLMRKKNAKFVLLLLSFEDINCGDVCNRPCCEQFHVAAIFFLLNYNASLHTISNMHLLMDEKLMTVMGRDVNLNGVFLYGDVMLAMLLMLASLFI